MDRTKLVLFSVLGCCAVVLLMVFGLMKMGSGQSRQFDQQVLADGARWQKENGETKVIVVEFSDLQCPACQVAEGLAKELRGMDGVRFIYRQFPLVNIHKNTMVAAETIEWALEKGKGWEVMELLFEKQSDWSEKTNLEMLAYLGQVVSGFGLDKDDLMKAIGEHRYTSVVREDLNLADKLGLPGTPTFIIDGSIVSTNRVMEVVKEKLKK